MTAVNLNRNINLFQCDDDAVSHFPIVGLNQILPRCARRTETSPIIEDSPIATIRSVPDGIVWPLLL